MAITSFVLYVSFPVSKTKPSYASSDLCRSLHRMRYITHSRTSGHPLVCLTLADVQKKSWNYWEIVIDVLCDVRVISHTSSRYSNTLLVSLNNRIYFRDHPSCGSHVDSGHVVESDQIRRSAVASLHFSTQGRPSTRTDTTDDGFKLHPISHTIDLERGKGDVVISRVSAFYPGRQ
jgi:hypothetical protein